MSGDEIPASSTVPLSRSHMGQRTTWGEALIPAPGICVHRELSASGAQNVWDTCIPDMSSVTLTDTVEVATSVVKVSGI